MNDGPPYYDSLIDAIQLYPTLVPIYLICLIVFAFVTKLFIYHLRIICKGESTYENLKGHYRDSLFNPYEKSCCKSFYAIFCKKKP